MKRHLALLALLSTSLSAAAVLPRPADQLDLDRPFDSLLWVTTHNAANFGSLFPNQGMDLQATPDAIVTLHLEDHASRRTLAAFIARRPDLFTHAFDPTDPRWLQASPRWPSLRQLIAAGQRLIITTQHSELSGTARRPWPAGLHFQPGL